MRGSINISFPLQKLKTFEEQKKLKQNKVKNTNI